MNIPCNPGAVLVHTKTKHMYVRDSRGIWHCSIGGEFVDATIQAHVAAFPTNYVVRSEGYIAPITEPRNLGAVVQYGSNETRAVFDGSVWVARWHDGSSSNVSWDFILGTGNITVLSEGVK